MEVKHNYLPEQYEINSLLEINHNYLKQQFSNYKEIFGDIEKLIHNGDYTLGRPVKEFEERFAKLTETKYAIGVGSGTDALFLSLKVLDIIQGDEVITTPYTFYATVGAIVATGAKPVFVDVRDDFNINPDLIEQAITDKTKAIIPVHLTGRPADLEPIIKIANKYNINVVEDAAQTIGARYYERRIGSFGITGCFSLHPLKNLHVYGDGGVITTDNIEIYNKIIKLRNHGLVNRDECEYWGYNSRLDVIQAAIANIKLKYIERWNETHRRIASVYRTKLQDIVQVPFDKAHEEAVYQTFVISCSNRNELKEYLLKQGIETKIHYPIPIHLQTPSKSLGYKKGDFPEAEKQAETILSLPIYSGINNEQINYIINKISAFMNTKK